MFYTYRQRRFITGKSKSFRPLVKQAVPIFVKNGQGQYLKFNGYVGEHGFAIASKDTLPIGTKLPVRIVLIGLGLVVEITGSIFKAEKTSTGYLVYAKFNNPSTEITKAIAKWMGIITTSKGITALA